MADKIRLSPPLVFSFCSLFCFLLLNSAITHAVFATEEPCPNSLAARLVTRHLRSLSLSGYCQINAPQSSQALHHSLRSWFTSRHRFFLSRFSSRILSRSACLEALSNSPIRVPDSSSPISGE